MGIKWKTVPNYPYYQVSNTGKIRSVTRVVSIKRNIKPFNRVYKGINKKPKVDGCGYYFTDLWKNNKCKFVKLHRLILSIWTNKSYNYDRQTNHIDGDKTNNNISNLEWVTPSENIRHAIKHGLRKASKGSKCYNAKLTEKDIPQIRKKFTGRYGELTKIANKYNVSPATIRDVVKNKTWRSVK